MASGLSPCVVVVLLGLALVPEVSAEDCLSYRDGAAIYRAREYCLGTFCCGTCSERYCCYDYNQQISMLAQMECKTAPIFPDSSVPIVSSVVGAVAVILTLICCCVCPCCCIYKTCRKPQPVIATTQTVVTTSRPYPQQQISAQPSPAHSYQGGPYPTYHHMAVQPGPGFIPTMGQPLVPGPPPTYQEATGPAYPYSPSAAFAPGQMPYPIQPPTTSSTSDFLSQPAYNPDFVAPPKTGPVPPHDSRS